MLKLEYKTWFFDCDGVILDSNPVKSDVFYEVALAYGKDKAMLLKKFHQDYGGISRFEKFNHFFANILKLREFDQELSSALCEFAKRVKERLLDCRETEGFRDFIVSLPKESRKIVISGGEQSELRHVFKTRGLNKYFDAIFGSPQDKLDILEREMKTGDNGLPAVFIGDSRYDHECAEKMGFDFIFMHQYSEFKDWPQHFKGSNAVIIKNLKDLK